LIQGNCNPKRLQEEVGKIVSESTIIDSMKSDYKQLREILGENGASDRAAKLIVNDEVR